MILCIKHKWRLLKKGILTKEMKSIAESEAMDEKFNAKGSEWRNCYTS